MLSPEQQAGLLLQHTLGLSATLHPPDIPQLEVGVRPEGVVELAGVAAAVLQPGRLYEELRHGGRARHHGRAHTAPGARELDTLRLETLL